MGRLFDIFVLIFCNSTASRLIYAYSHYNMCAGGGCMYQISNEKFGLFVTELRKEKNLTQKDLAEKLYVSDTTNIIISVIDIKKHSKYANIQFFLCR